ncbi:MAG: sugar ABC transporter substrate-binding protein [Planctomycetes bacterium]|nr:sugar ABC transporter substrate-binding protein [Planctomycetota bacterium]
MSKIIKCLFVSTFILVSFLGCGRKHSKEEITFAFWSDNFNRRFAERCVEYYNTNRNPRIPVRFFPAEGNYTAKLLTAIAGDSSPDIMLLMPEDIADFASRGALYDLTSFIEIDPEFIKYKSDSWKEVWDNNKFNGRDYGIPIWTNSISIFYNKTLFDKEGISYPDETWDWDMLLQSAKRLTKDADGDGRNEQFGFGGVPLDMRGWHLYLYIRQNRGAFFNEDRTKSLINMPEAVEAIQWVVDLSKKHHIAPTKTEMTTGEFGWGGETLLLTGRVAMIWGGRWMMLPLSDAKDLKFEWGVSPFPSGKQRVTVSAAVYLAISAKTKHPQECWEFLRFMMGEEGQKLVISDRCEIPVLKSLAYSQEYLNRFSRPRENEIFIQELEHAESYPYVAGQMSWMDEARQVLEMAYLGKISVKEACDEIARKHEILLGSGEIKP